MASSPKVVAKLDQIEKRLLRISRGFLKAARLYHNCKARGSIQNGANNNLYTDEHIRVGLRTEGMADLAGALIEADAIIAQLNPTTPPPPPPEQQTAPRTFPKFKCLPPELQLMAWEAAALPPPCEYYFAACGPEARDIRRLPAASMMPDRGLWTTCHDSRRTIQRAYRKCHAQVRRQAAYSADHASNTTKNTAALNLERQYRHLVRFNLFGTRLQKAIDKFNTDFEWHSVCYGPMSWSLTREVYPLAEEKEGRMIFGRPAMQPETMFEPS